MLPVCVHCFEGKNQLTSHLYFTRVAFSWLLLLLFYVWMLLVKVRSFVIHFCWLLVLFSFEIKVELVKCNKSSLLTLTWNWLLTVCPEMDLTTKNGCI